MNCRPKEEFIKAAGRDGSGVRAEGGDRKVDKRPDSIFSKCVTLAILIICTLHM